MTERGFDVQRFGAVARCSLNCPEKMNALSEETGEPMVKAVHELMADETVALPSLSLPLRTCGAPPPAGVT